MTLRVQIRITENDNCSHKVVTLELITHEFSSHTQIQGVNCARIQTILVSIIIIVTPAFVSTGKQLLAAHVDIVFHHLCCFCLLNTMCIMIDLDSFY